MMHMKYAAENITVAGLMKSSDTLLIKMDTIHEKLLPAVARSFIFPMSSIKSCANMLSGFNLEKQ